MARLILGHRDAKPSRPLTEAIRAGKLAGLLWFREALGSSVEEAAERVAFLRGLWPTNAPCLFAVDEEGGLIQQLCGLVDEAGETWVRLPSARALGRSGDATASFRHGREVGRRMRRIGLDVAFAPVVDLDPGPLSAVLGTRCFDSDPEPVADHGLAWLRGLSSAGVLGCLKHFPGHGATGLDTHEDLPKINPDLDPAPHRRPFERIGREWRWEKDGPPPGVLTAHMIPGSSSIPVTMDPAVLAAIPAGLGPIFTDSLDMGALVHFGDLRARASAALRAGADFLVVGLDVGEGLALADTLHEPDSPRMMGWARRARMPEPPAPWPVHEMEGVARAGIMVLSDPPIPQGSWDWILPSAFGPYGRVGGPVGSDPPGHDLRTAARVLRYDAGDPGSLKKAIENDPARPALVGWIHRGPGDPAVARMATAAWPRVRALVHLLDEPATEENPRLWRAVTSGFGELEIRALERTWALTVRD